MQCDTGNKILEEEKDSGETAEVKITRSLANSIVLE